MAKSDHPDDARPAQSRSLPARYPSGGVWPAEMPASIAAAFFGHETTGRLLKAIARGEALRPTATRVREKGRREPVWGLDACRRFVADRHGIVGDDNPGSKEEDIGALL